MELRVLYSFPDTVGKPGIGSIAREQVAGLVRGGAQVTLVATSIAAPLPGLARAVTTLELLGHRVPHRALGRLRAQRLHDRRAAGVLRRGSFDIVHVWPHAALRTLATARAAAVATLREVPNSHTAHAYEVGAAAAAAAGLPLAAGHSHTPDARRLAVEQAEYGAADALLVASEHARETFVERGFAAERLLLHRYGCDPRRFRPASGPPGGDPNRGLTALFAGRGEPRKGLHLALRAWRDSGVGRRGRMIVAGRLVDGYAQRLGELLDQPGVELRGFVDDLPALMREADLLLLPSLEEGTALVTYEAQAAGLVPVVSDAAGARCRHRVHGLVHRAGDLAALTADLRELDADRELLLRLRANALAHVGELTWDAAAVELIGCYRRALELRRGSAVA